MSAPESQPVVDRPLRGYSAILVVHTAAVGGALVVAARQGRLSPRIGLGDMALGAVATYKLSRLLTRSVVASPLRAPFTGDAELVGPAELLEEAEGEGVRRAVGELLTCPFCVGHWIASAHVLGLVFAPQVTRSLAGILCIDAGADLLQRLHARLDGD